MDHRFEGIRLGNTLSLADASALKQNGFVVIPGPVCAIQVPELVRAYDEVMQSAIGDDLKVGTTTTRLTDFVNRRAEFDGAYIFPPLLEACCFAISEPFKASAILGRTLHPHAPSQGLHVDIPRGYPAHFRTIRLVVFPVDGGGGSILLTDRMRVRRVSKGIHIRGTNLRREHRRPRAPSLECVVNDGVGHRRQNAFRKRLILR
jgi:hypothetical protein